MHYKEQECVLTEPEILDKLKYWQDKLGLDSWEIKFSFKKRSHLGPTEQAHCEWVLQKSSAIINIVCHEDYDNDLWPQDMEVSLVHELLHIKSAAFDNFEKHSLQDTMFEQFIDQMSKVIVTIDREVNHDKQS